MLRSMFAGITGIVNHQRKLDVVSNNIANANTVGFKRSRITFADTLNQTLRGATRAQGDFAGSNPLQVGLGVTTSSIDVLYEQGNLEATGQVTDMAIQGDGFFIISDGQDQYYTRAGAFQLDNDGFLLAQGGKMYVQGVMADAEGNLPDSTSISNVQLPIGMKTPANPTSEVEFYCNLNAEATDSSAALSSAGARTTGITTVSGTARNGIGGSHEITITGDAATQSVISGTNSTGSALTGSEVLSDLGITDMSELAISIDGADPITFNGLSLNMTVSGLLDALNNQAGGVTFSLVDGEIQMARDYYGSGETYHATLTQGAAADALNILMGAGSLTADSGTDSTLQAVDVFTASDGTVFDPVTLDLSHVDPASGQITNIMDLGGGGVTVYAAEGLQAGHVTVETADTSHSTSIYVYDSLGTAHPMSITFTRSGTPNQWNFSIDVPDPANTLSGSTGTILFNEDGSFSSITHAGGVDEFTFDPGNGDPLSISLATGTPGGFDGITQSSAPTTTIASSQDGYAMGTLESIHVDENGVVFGNYSNGESNVMAQVLLAQFNNEQGLEKTGESLYTATGHSGQAVIGKSGLNFDDTINSGFLEMSNIDIAQEFAEMIIAQRGFQANAKVVTTSDALLDEVIRMKR